MRRRFSGQAVMPKVRKLDTARAPTRYDMESAKKTQSEEAEG